MTKTARKLTKADYLAALHAETSDTKRLRDALNRYDFEAIWPAVREHLKVSPSQQKIYASGIKTLIDFARHEREPLLTPTPGFAERYHNAIQHLKPGSRRVRLAHARALYRVLRHLKAVNDHLDPFTTLHRATEAPDHTPDVYTDEEITRLLAHASTFERALILLGAHAGLATREVTSLQWSDLTTSDTPPHQQTLDSRALAGDSLRIHGREIAVPREVNDALYNWSREHGGALFASGPIFPDQTQARSLLAVLYRLCRLANVPYRAWRPLRHHYALRLYQQSHDAELVRTSLGLSSLKAIEPYRKLSRSQAVTLNRG